MKAKAGSHTCRYAVAAIWVTLAVSAAEAGRVVLVLNSGDASVSLSDLDARKEIRRYQIGREPHHLMATPDGSALIVANAAGNDLMFLDPTSGELLLPLDTGNIRSADEIALTLSKHQVLSPIFHRRHHASGLGHEGRFRGCNFAVLFPVWDMLFGTADYSQQVEPTGIRDQLAAPDGVARDYGRSFWAQQWLGVTRMFRGAA